MCIYIYIYHAISYALTYPACTFCILTKSGRHDVVHPQNMGVMIGFLGRLTKTTIMLYGKVSTIRIAAAGVLILAAVVTTTSNSKVRCSKPSRKPGQIMDGGSMDPVVRFPKNIFKKRLEMAWTMLNHDKCINQVMWSYLNWREWHESHDHVISC